MGAMWHLGHVVEPRVAHARRRRRTGRGHVAGGHACPWVHADARVGRHVAGGVAASHASDPSMNLRSRGPESTRSFINARAQKEEIS